MTMNRQYDFKPPVSQWDTDHLVFIANDETSIWEEDAIRQAREELTKRNITPEYERAVLDDLAKNDRFGERLLELGEIERESHALEDYKLWEKIVIFVCAPFILLRPSSFWENICGGTLSMLKDSGYKIKYRARLRLLLFGALAWVVLIWSIGAIDRYSHEKNRQKYPDPRYIKHVYPPNGPVKTPLDN